MCVQKITSSSLFIFLIFISGDLFSQSASLPKWEAGINAGAYVYQGDLTTRRFGSVETTRFGFGVSGTRIINRMFSARLMFNIANLAGDESIYPYPPFRKQRNLAFTASVKELTASFHWNILGTNYDDVKYEPYVFAGAGASFVNINRDYSRVNHTYFGDASPVETGLAVDIVTPTPRVIPVVPVGAGVRYHVSNKIVLNLEGSYRIMHNDYLDGFSEAANPNMGDHYTSVTIGASYKFGSKDKYGCPAAVN